MSGAHELHEPHSLFADLSTASASAGMALLSRRSHAAADYWRTFASVREPTDLVAVQLDYWSRMVDDYAAAFNASLEPIHADEAAPAPPSAAGAAH